MLVFDTQNPKKNAFEVSQAWVDIMEIKQPGRYKIKSAPTVVKIPKKKVVVVGKGKKDNDIYLRENIVVEPNVIPKKEVSLNTHQASAPTKRNQAKPKA